MEKLRLLFLALLAHVRTTRSIQLILLAVVFMFPQSLFAFEEYYCSCDENGVVHYGVGVNGIVYEVLIDMDGSEYDDFGYVAPKNIEATLLSYSRAFGYDEPITYGEWDTDSVLDIGSFYIVNSEYDMPTSSFPMMENLIYYLYGEIPVTSIADGALWGCTDLRDVRISSTVKRIGDDAFRNSSIRMLDVSDGYYEPIEIGEECCRDCSRLVRVYISRGIEEIPYGMCLSCPALTYASVYSQSTLKKIGALAFANCTSLPSFYASKGVDVIGKGAFANCYALKMIWLPKSTNTARIIGDYAFSNCHSLEYFNFNTVIQSIGKAAFINCSGLTYLTLPSSVTTISDHTFAGCSGLTDVKFHDALTTIGKRAFSACFALTNVEIPNSVTFIDEGAFNGGKSFYYPWDEQYLNDTTDLSIASSVESHEEYQGEMKKITIGESVDSIAIYAFCGIIPDTVICLANTPPACGGYWCFSRQAYSNTILCVPRVLVGSYAAATGWENFLHIQGIEVLGSGDLDGDGSTDVNDVTSIIELILGGPQPPASADVDGDGVVDVNDVTRLINKILNEN